MEYDYTDDIDIEDDEEEITANAIFLFYSTEKPGIMINDYSNSTSLIDEFLVSTDYEEVEWNDTINKPNSIYIEKNYEGSLTIRTIIASESEIDIIKEKLNKTRKNNEIITYLDLESILNSIDYKIYEPYCDIIADGYEEYDEYENYNEEYINKNHVNKLKKKID